LSRIIGVARLMPTGEQLAGPAMWVGLDFRRKGSIRAASRKEGGMDKDDRELMRRLFATMTGRLETAHEVAAAGQADLRKARTYARTAQQLRAMARQVASLADAALIVAESHCIHLKNHPKSRR
jgi:hypothetical protein